MNLLDSILEVLGANIRLERIYQNPLFIVDFIIISILLVIIYRLFKNTRAQRIFYGMLIISLILFLSLFFNLIMVSWFMGIMLGMLLITIPVVFQPELRSVLEKLGRTGFRSVPIKQSVNAKFLKPILETISILSKNKIDAILVIQRKTGLKEFIQSGTLIDAKISKDLLLSFFSQDSPLHDGAVIISEGRVKAASCILPLSENEAVAMLGTRHKAAMGLSEETDALIVVVSEKTGQVSLASESLFFKNISLDELKINLEKSLHSEIKPVSFFKPKNK